MKLIAHKIITSNFRLNDISNIDRNVRILQGASTNTLRFNTCRADLVLRVISKWRNGSASFCKIFSCLNVSTTNIRQSKSLV
jgi:hypothetical protein